ncbi:MAG: CPBP family intramembrane metalloprotease [Alistipes sp.]|nr:CPBP family intramembrane metalloprotease [Alistipes sp.]
MNIWTKIRKLSWVGDVIAILFLFLFSIMLVAAVLSLLGLDQPPVVSAIDEGPIDTYMSEQEALARYNAIAYPLTMLVPIVLIWIYSRLRGRKEYVPIRCSIAGFNPSVILVGVLWLLSSQILLEPLVLMLPQSQMPGVGLGAWAYVTAIVSAPVLEEILCRGVVFGTLRRRLGVKMSILLSALFFGLLHFDYSTAIVATVAGLIFGVLYVRTSSIFASMIVHSINNALAFVLIVWEVGDLTFRELINNDKIYHIVYGVAAVIFVAASIEACVKVLFKKPEKQNLQGAEETAASPAGVAEEAATEIVAMVELDETQEKQEDK